MNTKFKITSLLIAASLTLAACGNDNNEETTNQSESKQTETTESTSDNKSENDNSSNDNTNTSSSSESDELDMASFSKSIEDAIEEAKSRFDGQLTDIGVSKENNQYVYKIELESDTEEYEVSLDVNDLSVVKEETEAEDDENDNKYFNYSDLVKVEDAIQTAKDNVNGKVTEWSTDFDDGNLYYEIEIVQDNGNNVDVKVDAYTGDFVESDD
ncbi:PepSY domain-containing protein [Nosocomiicoccus massiliensis]|uniref:PepSY domain-containing protein n=1 Tax=Nosocomiicoccus massiliensis TaxID=1232430 RepID=A0AAF0YM94_9STAP|nr:PepSY domain-containing protein [Nosocomiicoccus massiliensis]WOS95762.1 PepSY domain-containing protein [Nosocomiicoccus massiliensis]